MDSKVNFLETLLARRGQIVTMKTIRPLKVRKGMPEIIKHSEFQARVGVNYDNIGAVKEKRETGELPAENAGLPWGEWETFPYVIKHKNEKYIRCTVLNNAFYRPAVYTVGGETISRDDAAKMALASEFRKSDDSEIFNIKLSSIVSVA